MVLSACGVDSRASHRLSACGFLSCNQVGEAVMEVCAGAGLAANMQLPRKVMAILRRLSMIHVLVTPLSASSAAAAMYAGISRRTTRVLNKYRYFGCYRRVV